jgi:hypothetical protein
MLSALAQAGTVSAKLWKLTDTDTYIAAPSTLPATTPDIAFSSPTPFNYWWEGTVGDWLANGGASGIAENTAGTLASLMSDGQIGSVVEFTGCVTVNTGDQFTFTHDDGMYLAINGQDLGFLAGPTSPYTETQTYTGPSGTFPFQLVYTENHAGPAVLYGGSDAFNNCPDGGSSMALMGLGLSALGLVSRRLRK